MGDGKFSIPELSADTRALMECLRAVPVGGLCNYSKLVSVAGGKDIRGRYRHLLDSARRKLMSEERILFGVVTGSGLQRLGDDGKAEAGIRDLKAMRNAARRGLRKLDTVEQPAALAPAQHARLLAARSMLGVISECTRSTTMMALVAASGASKKQLDIGATLQLFGAAAPASKEQGEQQKQS